MTKYWAVICKFEHEYTYALGHMKDAVALNTIKVRRQIKGDDEVCNAQWAVQQTLDDLRKQYIHGADRLHVVSIKVKEVL